MNATIKTGFTAILLLAISCKKENNSIQSSPVTASSTAEVITDITGKYPSVLIGTQKWMATNLAVNRYRNGDKIPQVTDPKKWANLTTGAWCWYNNDSVNGALYGRLYNWYAVNDPRGLAPLGWHVPSDTEWTTLSTYLGNNAGGKLKDTGTIEAGTGLWYAPNTGATNKTGFTGLPGGIRIYSTGSFVDIGYTGYWWTSTETGNNLPYAHESVLSTNNGSLYLSWTYSRYGFSVRCVKDSI